MRTHLTVLFVTAMLVAGMGTVPSSFAQVAGPITVSTENESYSDGERVVISGTVEVLLSGVPVSIQVFSPNGNLVTIDQLQVGEDKSFSKELVAGGPLWIASGTYTIKVQYGSDARVAEAMFEFGGSTVIPPPEETEDNTGTYSIDAGEAGTFDVGFLIAGGSVNSIVVDEDASSLIVSMDTVDDGKLTLTLPRDVIDAKMEGCEGSDEAFIVLVDGEQVEFDEVRESTDRVVTVEFYAGSEQVEIIGTCVIPEFGTVAVMILAVAIISIIVVSARSRLSLTPRY